ncbi:hypothetical protein Rs2_33676 [Raphanus sativus]|nr:hypothetical protein Rs2_33676 [Raphanus sativus]
MEETMIGGGSELTPGSGYEATAKRFDSVAMQIAIGKEDILEDSSPVNGIVEVPVFPYVELRRWISWMEHYFVRKGLTDLEKLHMVDGFIDGEAAEYLVRIQIRSWEEMKTKLIWEFGADDDPEKIVMKAKFDRCHKAFMNGDPGVDDVHSSLLKESWSLCSQVDPNLEQNRNDSQLGYRDSAETVDDSGSLIQNCEPHVFDKLPEFKGPNPTVWLSKAEKFFHTYGDNEKLTLVYYYLEGDAMKWFIRERRIMKFTDWSDFKCRLLAHFVHVPAYSSVEVHYKAESTSSNNSVSETELVKKKITSPNVEEVHEAEVHQQDLGCEIVLETVMVKQNDSGDFVAGVQQKELNHEAVQETNMLLPKESLAATDQELDLHCETGHVPSYLAGEAYQHVDSMNTDAVLKENLVDKNAERNQKWIEYSKPAIVKEDGVHDIDEGAKRSLMVIEQFQKTSTLNLGGISSKAGTLQDSYLGDGCT